MDFDKSRVYTALNADELKVGSKVYVADNLEALQSYVEDDCNTSTITSIMPECYRGRFKVDGYDYTFALAYLISEPEENKLKWSDLKLFDKIRTKDGNKEAIVTRIDKDSTYNHIFAGQWLSDEKLEEWEIKEND